MRELTATEKRALQTLVLTEPEGFRYDDDRIEPRAVFDALVGLGMAIKTEVEGQRHYQLSPEMNAAFAISVARANAETAALN